MNYLDDDYDRRTPDLTDEERERLADEALAAAEWFARHRPPICDLCGVYEGIYDSHGWFCPRCRDDDGGAP